MANDLGIFFLPTFMMFIDGEEEFATLGSQGLADLRDEIDKAVENYRANQEAEEWADQEP